MADGQGSIETRREKIQVVRRRAKVLEMYNRCSTQQEMAEALGVDQSTISRDLRVLSRQAKKGIDAVFHTNTALEAARLLDSKDLTNKERMAAISLLLKCYEARMVFLPSVLDAVEYEDQRKEMLDAMDRELDAEMERRGVADGEGAEESGGDQVIDDNAAAGPQDFSSLAGALEKPGGG